MRLQEVHNLSVILLVQNARDMEHAVLEDLDCNLLSQQGAIPTAHHDHGDGVMPEPRGPLGRCLLASALDQVPLA